MFLFRCRFPKCGIHSSVWYNLESEFYFLSMLIPSAPITVCGKGILYPHSGVLYWSCTGTHTQAGPFLYHIILCYYFQDLRIGNNKHPSFMPDIKKKVFNISPVEYILQTVLCIFSIKVSEFTCIADSGSCLSAFTDVLMSWYGVVWRGMAWYAMAWNGVAWCGVPWCSLIVEGWSPVIFVKHMRS